MDCALREERTIRRCRVPVNKILPQAQFEIAAAGNLLPDISKLGAGNIRQR